MEPSFVIDAGEDKDMNRGGLRDYVAGRADWATFQAMVKHRPDSNTHLLLEEYLLSKERLSMKIALRAANDGSTVEATGQMILLGYDRPSVTLTIPDHTRVYAHGTEANLIGATITLDESKSYMLAYDDEEFTGGELNVDIPVIVLDLETASAGDAYFSAAHPYRHYLCTVNTVDEAGSGGSSGGSSPPGGGGWTGEPGTHIP
ncbi:MAG: hypothetical protein DI637_01520 [Citromicrobium sp.]|nr:MAG: hypothetical protein DI637_01520 [Citromicrobium sp.]